MQTAILFLIFNRPDTTRRVFHEIRRAAPNRLYIAGDGPRAGRPEEARLCSEAREIIALIDWPCEVKTLLREENLGCRMAVSSAITWFFEHEAEGIILEDDCLPHPSFFPYCEELLQRYRHEDRVMHISGDNFQEGKHRGDPGDSYYFSIFNHIWGWASWRRAWKHYDVELRNFDPALDEKVVAKNFGGVANRQFWMNLIQRIRHGEVDTWDYQWTITMWAMNGLAILPNVNLVSNIGFGSGTHTQARKSIFADMPTQPVGPLDHPDTIAADRKADALTMRKMYLPGWMAIVQHKISKWFNK